MNNAMKSGARPTVVLLEASADHQVLAKSALATTAFVSHDLGVFALLPSQASRLVLVDLTTNLERSLQRLVEVCATIPSAQIIAVDGLKDPNVILRAMRSGACEFATFEDGPELASILGKLLQHTTAKEPSGVVVSIFPAKGGVGATTLALNLAAELCALDKRVLLVDLDRHLGTVLASLDTAPAWSLAELVANQHRLDRELLLSSLAQHSSGAYVVAYPDSIQGDDPVSPAQIRAVLQFTAKHFDFVICDGLRGFGELTLAALDVSDQIALLLSQDVIALKNARRCLELFHRLAYDGKVSLVVGEFHSKSAVDLAAITENLGPPVRAALTMDRRAASDALDRGVLLKRAAPRSQLTADIERFAADLAGVPREKPRGFLGALFRIEARRKAPSGVSETTAGGSHVARPTS